MNTFSLTVLLLNLYLSKNNNIVEPHFLTFRIAKTVSDGDNRVKTVLLFDLISNCTDAEEKKKMLLDNLKVYNTFCGIEETEIELKLEYPFYFMNANV